MYGAAKYLSSDALTIAHRKSFGSLPGTGLKLFTLLRIKIKAAFGALVYKERFVLRYAYGSIHVVIGPTRGGGPLSLNRLWALALGKILLYLLYGNMLGEILLGFGSVLGVL